MGKYINREVQVPEDDGYAKYIITLGPYEEDLVSIVRLWRAPQDDEYSDRMEAWAPVSLIEKFVDAVRESRSRNGGVSDA